MWHHFTAYHPFHHFTTYHPIHHYASHTIMRHTAVNHGGWLVHTIIGGIIHGLIYGAIFHLMRGMSIGSVLLVAVIGVAVIGGGYWMWTNRR